jgi:hypothetical protein
MRRRIFWILSVLCLLWLLIPTADNVAPDWTILVTDTEGHPISGASVTVFSRLYTHQSSVSVPGETQITSADGRVHFEERRIQTPGIQRLLLAIRSLTQEARPNFGTHTSVGAFKTGYGDPSELAVSAKNERESTANQSRRQESHLVLQKCKPGYGGKGCCFPDDPDKPILPSNN